MENLTRDQLPTATTPTISLPAVSLILQDSVAKTKRSKNLGASGMSSPEPIEPQVSLGPIVNLGYNIDGKLTPDRLLKDSQQRSRLSRPSSPSGSAAQSDQEPAEWDETNKLPALILSGINSARDTPSDSIASARASAKNNTCFGMIHNTRAKLLDPGTITRDTLGKDLLSSHFYPIQLVFRDGCAFLSAIGAERFAVLNEEVTKVLRGITASSCRLEAYLGLEEWESLLQKLYKFEKDAIFLVDIVLYGSKMVRDDISTLLSDSKIYLQHPCYEKPDTDYDNPHFLKLTDLSSALNSASSFKSENDHSRVASDAAFSGLTPVGEITTRSQLRQKMATVYNSLTRSKKLERIEADVKITTELLPHQKEALCFMAQREVGPIPKEFRLWQPHVRQNLSCYEHVVTNERAGKCPLETIGGILADDMGLGKTLTVISTIIRTAEDAQTFAANENSSGHNLTENDGSARLTFSRSTLVVVPSPLLIDEWIQEINTHCDGSLNVTIYHGRGREVDSDALAQCDIVLSTYHTIAAESLEEASPLYKIIWFRVVLDEAHMVRNSATKLYKAVSKLSAKFRWCLTGTPVQNSLEDLAALVAFIRAGPLDSLPNFRKHIISPLVKGTDQGLENIRLLLDSVCLRRTNNLLHLPEVFDEDRFVEFSAAEDMLYKSTQAAMIKAIKQHDSQSRNTKGYFGIFQLQLQLRCLCNHGTFQRSFSEIADNEFEFDPDEAFAHLQKRGDSKCSYCNIDVTGLKDMEDKVSGSFTICGHLLCSGCIPQFEKGVGIDREPSNMRCPLCLRTISKSCLVSDNNNPEKVGPKPKPTLKQFEERGTSSKLSALIMDLDRNLSEGKSIVFSCWTRSLDLVGTHLTSAKIPFDRIDGTYTLSQRHRILEHYHSDPETRVLLMTTGTGAVGLNLTIANCVYLLEPQWNPMVESQAIARVLRLGQHRNVKVVRYIVRDTVEVGMRSQQTRKRDFAQLGWKNDS